MQCYALLQSQAGELVSLFNMLMNAGPSIMEYFDSVSNVAGGQPTISAIPYRMLLAVVYAIDLVSRSIGIKHPFSPVRTLKPVRPNSILPSYLVENSYGYQYTLESGFADWKNKCPKSGCDGSTIRVFLHVQA